VCAALSGVAPPRIDMGTWGTSLYSGDFPRDLRATVGAVLRLPFPPDKLAEIVCETASSAANNPADEEHTIFWLVLADQFARHGVVSERVRSTALAILDGGDDLAVHEKLGMKPTDVQKRSRTLEELRARLVATPIADKRRVLRKPQVLLMNVGDVMVYPTCGGANINPYYATKELIRHYSKDGPGPWKQDGWGAMVIVDCGRAFDFLAWYRPLTVARASEVNPSMDALHEELIWSLRLPGTCSSSHFKKMELTRIGVLAVDQVRLQRVFPGIRPGTTAAIADISLGNSMKTAPAGASVKLNPGGEQRGFPTTIIGIDQILQR